MLYAKSPGAVTFEPDEIEDINLIQVCLILNKLPDEVRAMNPRDLSLVLQIHRANQQIEAFRAEQKASAQRRAAKRGKRGH